MIHVLNDYILIKPEAPAKGNLPDRPSNKAFSIGTVEAYGLDVKTELKKGEKVHYKTSSYHIEVEDEGEKFIYVKASELLGKIS